MRNILKTGKAGVKHASAIAGQGIFGADFLGVVVALVAATHDFTARSCSTVGKSWVTGTSPVMSCADQKPPRNQHLPCYPPHPENMCRFTKMCA